jgi:hypothetical protein
VVGKNGAKAKYAIKTFVNLRDHSNERTKLHDIFFDVRK